MRVLIVVGLALLFAASAFAWTPAEVEQAMAAEQSGQVLTPEHKLAIEEYSNSLIGQPQISNAGGPDAFGYAWKDSEEPDGPVYEWWDITATGTSLIDLMLDDNTIGPYPIGFDFPYYGGTFNQFWVGSNGAINFDGTSISLSNYELPSTSGGAHIALFHDDMDPADAPDAELLYEVVNDGTQDILIISCINWDEYPGNADPAAQEDITAQYQLFADGTVRLMYQAVEAGIDIAGCTIGIQNATRDIGLTVLHNGSIPSYPYAELAIEFATLPTDATLSGTVTEFGTGAPLSDVTVSLMSYTTTTGLDGTYNFPELYSGVTVDVTASKALYYPETQSITLQTGDNTLDFVLEQIPPPDYFTDFEDDGEPFGTDSPEWEWGMVVPGTDPNYPGPGSAYSGDNAWATNLDGLHGNTGGVDWLISNEEFPINDDNARVEYWHWQDYYHNWDGYNFSVSTDGGATWELVDPIGGYPGTTTVNGEPVFNTNGGAGNVWEQVVFELGQYDGQTLLFGFKQMATSVVAHYGVVIDDFMVYGTSAGGPVDFNLNPVITEIPPGGGTISYDVSIISTLNLTVPGLLYWTEVQLPNGQMFGPLFQIQWTHTPMMNVTVVGLTQNVPSMAPSGLYEFHAWAGYMAGPNLTDSFNFTKIGTAADGVDNWNAGGNFIVTGDETVSVQLPKEYTLEQVYPNPFNPTANVTVALPEAADLSVTVFNVMGQQVAELTSGQLNAGVHTFTLDGSALSSGLYFVKANVPGKLNQIQKVTLMK